MKFLKTLFAGGALASVMLISALPVAAADEAMVRVLHASPDAPAVDVYLDDAMVDALANVPFGAISGYLAIPAGDHNIKVYATGTTTGAVIDADVALDAGKSYTVAAIGALADIQPAVLVDDPALEAGSAMVRVVHFSPDAPAVDVAPDGADPADAVVSGLEFPNDTGYLALPPDTYDLEVRLAGTTDVALQLDPVDLAAGTAYSVFAIGSAADPAAAGNALSALVAVDGQFMPDTATADEPSQAGPNWWAIAALVAVGAVLLAIAARLQTARVRR